MERFSYIRAASIAQAVTLLNEPQVRSRVLAGGTDLVLLAREDRRLCDRVVDITQIGELHRITAEGDTIRIGAAATFSEVVESPLVNATAPVLVEACRQVGATQVRNMGTLGGNVANAAACADSLPALVCLDAVAEVMTPAGPLEWPVAELVVRPNRTLIPAGGLLVSLRFRVPAAGSRSTFIKLGRRNAMAISRLTVAALGRLDAAGRVAEARLVPGSATPQILRFSAVEKLLLGQQPGDELFDAAGRLAVDEMARLSGRRWSSEYKEPALAGMVCQALATVFAPGADKDATRTTHEN
ncbi:MAG TPA: FAD binding domain-containing protein [Anaerolineae bacterium]